MSPGGKVLVSVAVLGTAFSLILWRQKQPRDVQLSSVTLRDTLLASEPGAGSGLTLPKGLTVQVTRLIPNEWAYVTLPASISWVVFGRHEDFSGWVPFDVLDSANTHEMRERQSLAVEP